MDSIINKNRSIQEFFQIGFWDIIVGIPAGVLIFMTTVLFTALASLNPNYAFVPSIVILAAAAFLVGILAGITRLRKGPATALAAAMITSGILAYLRFSLQTGDKIDSLVIGAPGIIFTIITCPIGGWLGARMRKAL